MSHYILYHQLTRIPIWFIINTNSQSTFIQKPIIKNLNLSPQQMSLPPNKQQQIFLTCYFCQLSQQQCQSDLLIDTKCAVFHSCYRCYMEYRNTTLDRCPKPLCKAELKDHVKLKNSRKEKTLDEGVKMFEKQVKVRGSWEDIDSEFVQLLAYFSRNSKLNEYQAKEREIKVILQNLRKKENLIYDDLRKMKIPQMLRRENNDPTGKEACGYESNYEKGLMFLFESFGM